jgi:hypothetical protein
MSDQPRDPAKQDSSSTPSFWERLGKNVGKGIRAAKDVGNQIGSEARQPLERQKLEEHLESQYRILGKIVAEEFLDPAEPLIRAEEPRVQEVLEEIRRTREALRDFS